MAQIVVLDHGGHARPVINRGQKHLRSRMGSRKTGLQQVVEGRGHRDLTMWNEANPQCLDFQAHPFLIRGQVAGEPFDYYPDHIRLMRDGLIELIEVKRSCDDLGDPAYRRKLGAVAEIARRGGWTFRILYHADITGPRWRMRNVEAIYARRYLLLDREEQDVVNAFVMNGDSMAWSMLRDILAPDDTFARSAEAAPHLARSPGNPISNAIMQLMPQLRSEGDGRPAVWHAVRKDFPASPISGR